MKKCLMFPPETRCLPLSGLPLMALNITTVQLQWSNLEMEHKLSIFFTDTIAKNCLHLFTWKKNGISPTCIFLILLKVYFIPLIILGSYYKAMIDKHNLLTYYIPQWVVSMWPGPQACHCQYMVRIKISSTFASLLLVIFLKKKF